MIFSARLAMQASPFFSRLQSFCKQIAKIVILFCRPKGWRTMSQEEQNSVNSVALSHRSSALLADGTVAMASATRRILRYRCFAIKQSDDFR
jgi:hypothetical protein